MVLFVVGVVGVDLFQEGLGCVLVEVSQLGAELHLHVLVVYLALASLSAAVGAQPVSQDAAGRGEAQPRVGRGGRGDGDADVDVFGVRVAGHGHGEQEVQWRKLGGALLGRHGEHDVLAQLPVVPLVLVGFVLVQVPAVHVALHVDLVVEEVAVVAVLVALALSLDQRCYLRVVVELLVLLHLVDEVHPLSVLEDLEGEGEICLY